MDLGIKDRTALVCAASNGLGRAAAEALAGSGCRVAICARRAESLQEAVESMRAQGGDVVGIPADLSDPAEVHRLLEVSGEELGPIDILVNNNGGPPPGGFDDVDDDDWRAAFDLTFMSTVTLYRGVLPAMKQQGWGRIINIASLSVMQPIDDLILSNAMRLAVQGLAKSISLEVAPYGITVNSVCPGFTRTQRVTGIICANAERLSISESEAEARLAATTAIGRIGEPVEVGAAVAFLASAQSAFITGAAIPVAGGGVRSSV